MSHFPSLIFAEHLFGKIVTTNELFTGGDSGFLTFYSSLGILGLFVYFLSLTYCLVHYRCSLPSYLSVFLLLVSSLHYPTLTYPGAGIFFCFVILVDSLYTLDSSLPEPSS